MRDFLVLAVNSILHRRRRSWLTVIGIFIGIAAVVALTALGQSLDQSITREFESIGADKIFINPGGNPTSTQQFAASAATLTDDDLATIRRTRGVAEVAGVFFRSTPVTYQDESRFQVVTGIPTDESGDLVKESFTVEMASGRDIRSTDRSNVVIGARLADSVFEQEVRVHDRLQFQEETFRVVGVMQETGDPEFDRSVVLPIKTARTVFDTTETTYDYIIARAQSGFAPDTVKDRIERELRQERGLEEGEEDFTVSSPQDIIASFRAILNFVQLIVVGIAAISLLVGGVGIMNTMYTAVVDRTREIGIMKAVGATNRQIMLLFLIESGMIGLVGGALGVALGAAISQGIGAVIRSQAALDVTMTISPTLIGGALMFSFVVGTLSGIMPARQAAKMHPVDALRYE